MAHKQYKWVVDDGAPALLLLTRIRTLSTKMDPHPAVVWQLPGPSGRRWNEAFDTEIEATAYGLERAIQEQSNLRQSLLFTKAAIKKASDDLIRHSRASARLTEELEDSAERARALAARLARLNEGGKIEQAVGGKRARRRMARATDALKCSERSPSVAETKPTSPSPPA